MLPFLTTSRRSAIRVQQACFNHHTYHACLISSTSLCLILQGVAYSYGLEPGFLGSLAFYATGWEYREGPVQLTALLPNAHGMAELEEFRSAMDDSNLLRP